MGLVSIDKLSEGMVLAGDVVDRSGRLLLEADTVLSARHIRMFMTWGVRLVDIAGQESMVETENTMEIVDQSDVKAAEDELKPLFRNVDMQHPAMVELFRICAARKVSNASLQA